MTETRAVLIVGGGGFLGHALAHRLREGYRVISTFMNHPILLPGALNLPLDLKDGDWLKTLIWRLKPEIIIYIAGYQDYGYMEGNPSAAERVISAGPGEILKVADVFQPKLIYLSSCYVFDGIAGCYEESHALTPHHSLGKLKASGENLVKSRASSYSIIRSSPLFGMSHPYRPAVYDQIRVALLKGEKIQLQNQELHSFAPMESMLNLIDQIIQTSPKKSILHWGGLTRLTHYDLGKRVAKLLGKPSSLIVASNQAIEKPKGYNGTTLDYSLNSSKAVNQFRLKSFEIDEGLEYQLKSSPFSSNRARI